MKSLEAAFVKIARKFGQNRGITYGAWRDAGVPAVVLKKAGVARTAAELALAGRCRARRRLGAGELGPEVDGAVGRATLAPGERQTLDDALSHTERFVAQLDIARAAHPNAREACEHLDAQDDSSRSAVLERRAQQLVRDDFDRGHVRRFDVSHRETIAQHRGAHDEGRRKPGLCRSRSQ